MSEARIRPDATNVKESNSSTSPEILYISQILRWIRLSTKLKDNNTRKAVLSNNEFHSVLAGVESVLPKKSRFIHYSVTG